MPECSDIACQLVRKHPKINVIAGGGQVNFVPTTEKLPLNKTMYGNRTDNVNLIKEWEQLHAGDRYCTVLKFSDLDKCDPDDVDYMFGRSPSALIKENFWWT